jgi:hypothetical protein
MTNVKKYKSIPTYIDAIQFTKDTQNEIELLLNGYLYTNDIMTVYVNGYVRNISLGDWILFQGPIPVMSDAQFKQHYELAND